MSLSQRVLGAVDLAIEFATLGEYGLEQVETIARDTDRDHCRRERSGHAKRMTGWEALATARRGRCARPILAPCGRPRVRTDLG